MPLPAPVTLLKRALALAVAAPVVSALGVTAIDQVRVRRSAPVRGFPRDGVHEVETAGNCMHLFTHGDELFARMLADIRAATTSIYLESFIWKADPTGEEFKRELTAAAHRGVEVFVIYDEFANLVVPRHFKTFDPALHVLGFPLLTLGNPFAIQTYARDHRKILVVDDRVGYIGGYNIGATYAETWRDTHLRIEGEAVWELSNAFVDFWNKNRKSHHPALSDRGARSWEPRVRAVQNLPDQMLFPVRGTYLDAIDRSTSHVLITQGYFLPDDTFIRALLRAVERGVDVRVLIPEHSNHIVADWASRSAYARMLAGGIRIFLFHHTMIHAKTMTVDGRWTTIGTTNIDRLSFTGNFEVNLEIYDRDLARTMEEVFARDLSNSHELTAEQWAARPVHRRVVERLVRPLAPFL